MNGIFNIIESENYRADIDGLRAIAVIGVILFHFDFEFIQGGFVGVDVFFVISGFLITRNILLKIEAGQFSFRDFFVRRVRRLFPALFVTLFVSFIVGFIVLLPNDFEKMSQSLIYSVLSVSNLYFWADEGYFSGDKYLKPLLHMWSLSVEEQYYLVWPFILFLLYKIRYKWLIQIFIITSIIIFTYIAEQWIDRDLNAAFYLTPFRVAEFAVGALCFGVITESGV